MRSLSIPFGFYEIDTDIIQYFVERLNEKLNEIDIDIIQCFVDRLTETLDE
jgi:hypothetical protein